jgi:penicillin-binding protein 2
MLPAPHAPRVIERSPGLEEEERHSHVGRPPASPLKRLEDEERDQARRAERVRAGVRLTVMGVVVLGLFSVMMLRLWSMQVLHSSSAINNVIALTTRPVTISPIRGLIEARGGQVLVGNKVEPVVTLSRQVAAQDPAVVERLAVTLGIPVSQVYATINDQQDSIYEPVPVQVGVSDSTIVYLAEHRSMFPGVSVTDVAERQYHYGDTASQTLGYVGDISQSELQQLKGQGYTAGDVIGQSGIEYQYERYLRGKPGVRNLEVDASGDPVGTKSVTPAKPGDNVVLNIDLALQEEAQKQLETQIRTLAAQNNPVNSGAVVVEDPQNGAILAMVSLPSYDPSWWVGGMSTAHYAELTKASSNYPMLNRAIQGLYIPGSTFKLATATAALDTSIDLPGYGPFSAGTMINDPGTFTVPNCSGACTFHDDESTGCGSCNVTTAIAMSDDVFFYTLGYWFFEEQSQYGLAIQKAAAAYGLGQPTGVDLPGETVGQVDSPLLRIAQHKEDPKAFPNTYYGPGDALETAFGQGETVITPLQLANAYSTFANGGTRYAPEVAAEITSAAGKVLKRFAPKVLGHVSLPASTRDPMLQGFEEEVTNPIGTGYPPYQSTHYPYSELPIAGKTGTSDISSSNPNLTNALYVAFGPTSHPRYCIAVVIPGGGYGDEAAAPVAFRLFEWLIKHPVGSITPSVPRGQG